MTRLAVSPVLIMPMGQLSLTGAVSEAFGYGDAGNRTSHTKTDGTTVGYTVDPTGQLVSDTTGTTYSYDAAGNLTSTSDGVAYGYDDYGRHSSITAGGVTQTYGYDATGTRVTVDGETQLWDRTGLPTLISTQAGDNYLHTAGISRNGDAWLLADAVGSVRATTDGTGVVTGTAGFTASGEQLTGTTDTFGFAGEQQDPTGLIHLRARQYNPTLGRFTSVDPIQPGAPGTTGYNLYAYSGNNPTTWTDPSGQTIVEYQASVNTRFQAIANATRVGAASQGRAAALAELQRQAATRALMLQLRQLLTATVRTQTAEILLQAAQGSNPDTLRQVRTDQDGRPVPAVGVGDPGSGQRSETDLGECPDLGPGSANYGDFEARSWNGTRSQFATGAIAVLTPTWLENNGAGTAPRRSIMPPGIPANGYQRGHLLAAVLGGSNTDGRNFVSLHQIPNNGEMKSIELQVRNRVRSCDVIEYTVFPNYDYAVQQPLESLDVLAVSATAGVLFDKSIANVR